MSGETDDHRSSWTIDTLKESFEQQMHDMKILLDERYATQTKALDAAFVAAEKAVATALESADRAVAKAETAYNKRFEAVNEFRGQLADQGATFMTRVEFDAKHEALEKQVNEMAKTMNRAAGRSTGVSAAMATVLTAGGLLVAIIVAVVTIVSTR